MKSIDNQAQEALESLQKTVHELLDRKKRLGQYAVVWKDDKIVHLFEDEEETHQKK